ncbi:MAG: archease [Candidatus Omnitrophica bacterium]|nr:archease [Candidatus Omnitrophota bacterium]
MKKYRQIFHTADLGALIYGKSMPALYENAAYAMFDMMTRGTLSVKLCGTKIKKIVRSKGPDKEALLVNWLNDLLYLSFKNKVLLNKFKIINLSETGLKADVRGYVFAKEKNPIKKEIKAATYHDVEIKKVKNGHAVQLVFDV